MRYSKALAAAIIAAFMCMTPLFVIDDADAAFTEDKAGFSVCLNNPTDAELTSVAGTDRTNMTQSLLGMFLSDVINVELFGPGANFSADSFEYDTGEGQKIGSDDSTAIWTSKAVIKGFSISIPVTASGSITVPVTSETPDDVKAIIGAIKDYIGNVAAGDKVVVTGDITFELATEEYKEFSAIDDATSVRTKWTGTEYNVFKFDIKCEVIKSGEETGKSIGFVCDVKGTDKSTKDYKYDAEMKDIVPSTTGKMTKTEEIDVSGSGHFTVDGKDYDLDTESEEIEPETTDITASYYIVSNNSMTIDADLKAEIAALPESSGNMTVAKEYSDAQSLFDDVKDDVVGKKNNTTLFIIIGAVVAVVVIGGIVAFVFLRKKA